MATATAGGIAAPLNHRLGEKDVRSILENAAPRVVVTEPAFRDVVEGLASDVGATVAQPRPAPAQAPLTAAMVTCGISCNVAGTRNDSA